eukprot:3114085-Pleurochrysis_carterae.AAC.1
MGHLDASGGIGHCSGVCSTLENQPPETAILLAIAAFLNPVSVRRAWEAAPAPRGVLLADEGFVHGKVELLSVDAHAHAREPV